MMMLVMIMICSEEFDNCDLSNHRGEGTRVQNRRNVQVGSCDNQQKPRSDKDGFLHHARLGLVGWISYWCFGDSAVVVFSCDSHNENRDSESREKGRGDCCEGAQKGQTCWTLLDLQARDVSWYHELRREEVRVAGSQVGGVQGHQVLRRGQCPRR
jgi:hypothetical protein